MLENLPCACFVIAGSTQVNYAKPVHRIIHMEPTEI
jgi:hypothetical protein